MPNETKNPIPNGSSNKWLLAAIPALGVIAFLIYSAVIQAKDEEAAENSATSGSETTQDATPPAGQSGK